MGCAGAGGEALGVLNRAAPADPEFRPLPADPPQTQPDMTPGAQARRSGRGRPVHLGPELRGGPDQGRTHSLRCRPPAQLCLARLGLRISARPADLSASMASSGRRRRRRRQNSSRKTFRRARRRAPAALLPRPPRDVRGLAHRGHAHGTPPGTPQSATPPLPARARLRSCKRCGPTRCARQGSQLSSLPRSEEATGSHGLLDSSAERHLETITQMGRERARAVKGLVQK